MKGLPAILLLAVVLAGCRSTSNLSPVSGFEAERYMGVWYEAVRYPHRFEKDLAAVSAEYQLQDDGTVSVLNRGYDTVAG